MQLCPGCGSSVAGDATTCPICGMSLGPVAAAEDSVRPVSAAGPLGNDALRVAPDIPLPSAPTPVEELKALPIVRRNWREPFNQSPPPAPKAPSVPRATPLAAPAAPRPTLQGPPVPPPSTRSTQGPLPLQPPTAAAPWPSVAPPPAASAPAPLGTRPQPRPTAPVSTPRPPLSVPAVTPPARSPISRAPRASITTSARDRGASNGVPAILVLMSVVVICIYFALLLFGRERTLGPNVRDHQHAAHSKVLHKHRAVEPHN